jgi:4-hydroxy-2-oxoglutarate aldolase
MQLDGILPPVPTPFLDGAFDPTQLGANIRRYLTTGIRGIVVLGSSGEAPLLDEDESDRAIEAAREAVPRHFVLVAGTGRESTRATIDATARAARAGADAVRVRTPSYFKSQMTSDVFVAHYRAVADASPVPVLLYNVTVFTGVNLLPAAVARLAEHPNIAGMKESGGDITQIAEIVAVTPDKFRLFAGSATAFYPALCAGASGAILALATVVPELAVRMTELVRAGRHDEARLLQQRITPLARLVTTRFGIAGLKAAAALAGYPSGMPRPPLLPLASDAHDEIARELSLLSELTAQRVEGV